ncbi:SDR family oxidoreductase [Roseomonas populi]|uniref:SDR family oxidoreductase n=1 Tax=Roseomonas populi TaxID=3121582 RepID=A0ABT1X7S6_9PROT|nr:SDR family oxidoreductase [Roseomonas pecuniae]MCR0983791.1 SDR family oxidoreductase [Roseomonas pecuniae]
MKLSGKVALVTGGTSGIGLATAALFSREGAQVVAVGNDPGRLSAAAAALGGNGIALQADLRRPAEIDRLVEAVRDRYGRLNILFANAGLGLAAPLEAVTEAQIDEQFAVNFKGLFFTVQKAVPLMERGGSIVLTTSYLNTVGTPGLSILSATKGAVRSLARTLGAELAPRGIRVNALSPGPISTPFAGKLGLSQQDLQKVAEHTEAKVPLRRFGEADEVANAVLFLAGPDGSYVTGTELVVDGGLTQI